MDEKEEIIDDLKEVITEEQEEILDKEINFDEEISKEIEKESKSEIIDIDKIEDEISGLKDKLRRNLAEFDNFRKRTTKEKQSMYGEGVKDSVMKILPVIDNFERALMHQEDKEDTLYTGIDMIFKQLIAVLDELGVKEIDCVDKEFDPNLHYAVAKESVDDLEENIIIDVLQKGYVYKEKLLRPAMVKVSE